MANYFWDYNTVEMILLACSILVCLAGVMFESDRFVGRDDLDYQRLMISVGVMLVIMFSCLYYGIVLLSEVTGHTPEWVKRWMAKNKWGSKLGKDGSEDDDSDDELGIEMAFRANPMHSGEGADAEVGNLKGEMGKIKGERDEQAKVNRKLMEELKKEKEKNAKLEQLSLAKKHRRSVSGNAGSSRRARKGFAQKKLGALKSVGSAKSLDIGSGGSKGSERSDAEPSNPSGAKLSKKSSTLFSALQSGRARQMSTLSIADSRKGTGKEDEAV